MAEASYLRIEERELEAGGLNEMIDATALAVASII